jgi:hypothetical protein
MIFLIIQAAGWSENGQPSIIGYSKSENEAYEICKMHNSNPYTYHWWYAKIAEVDKCSCCDERDSCIRRTH